MPNRCFECPGEPACAPAFRRLVVAPFWRVIGVGFVACWRGFCCGQNITGLWVERMGERLLVVVVVLVILEMLVRVRTRLVADRVPLAWVVLDNLRIGLVYALVLEAFKLGS